jgi:catechol 2,3-dioxygenase-like lactoylglutathione lyase family enzyme
LALHTPDLDRLKSLYENAFGFQMVGEEGRFEDVPEAALITGVPGAAAAT